MRRTAVWARSREDGFRKGSYELKPLVPARGEEDLIEVFLPPGGQVGGYMRDLKGFMRLRSSRNHDQLARRIRRLSREERMMALRVLGLAMDVVARKTESGLNAGTVDRIASGKLFGGEIDFSDRANAEADLTALVHYIGKIEHSK